MPAALILVTTLLPLLPGFVGDVEALWTAIFGVRTALQQSNDWTPEAEAAFQQALVDDGKSSDWQPKS
jgi:hypothetical protein